MRQAAAPKLLGPGVDVGFGHGPPRQNGRRPIGGSGRATRSTDFKKQTDKYGPADLAGPYDLGERPGAQCWIYPVQASM